MESPEKIRRLSEKHVASEKLHPVWYSIPEKIEKYTFIAE